MNADSPSDMPRTPIFLRPLTPLTEEEEAAEVAEVMRLLEAAFEAAGDDETDRSTTRGPAEVPSQATNPVQDRQAGP